MTTDLKTKVQELIDTMINPAVAGPGGSVELIDVQDNRVYLQMGGGCQGCGAADVTLKSGIERLIKEEIPEVAEVLDTTPPASRPRAFVAAALKLGVDLVCAAERPNVFEERAPENLVTLDFGDPEGAA